MMEMMSLWPLLIVSLSGVLAQTNLDNKVFVFPKRSNTNYVLLRPTLEQQLQQFTLCLSYFSDLTEPFALFSAASRQQDNEILLIKQSSSEYHVWVGGEHLVYKVLGNMAPSRRWTSTSTCLTWDSATGIVRLWVDGAPLPRKGVAKGQKITTELSVMLGQDQDSFGGSLDAQQSFVGEMDQVYLWDTILPPVRLHSVSRSSHPLPLVDWTALNFEIKGNVVIVPYTS